MTKEEAFKKLDQIAVECQHPNWGGKKQYPVSRKTTESARGFIEKYLKAGGEFVDVYANPQGMISVCCGIKSRFNYTISVDIPSSFGENRFVYACLLKKGDMHLSGVEQCTLHLANLYKLLKLATANVDIPQSRR